VERHVALLRGINLGPRNRLSMKDLVAMFDGLGCESVATYIQSGNVVFAARAVLARRVSGLIEAAIQKQFGFEVPVIVRSAGELRDTVRRNPFLKSGAEPGSLHVAFLRDRPLSEKVKTLDPDRSPPDAFALRERDLYLYCPKGYGRSKLTNAYFDSRLATISTVRNWRTVLTLCELAAKGE
jgi:uncharacterized protein (DUF1697 family)